MMNIEEAARREKKIVLVMDDQDMADFYIDMLESHAWVGTGANRKPDVGVQDDLKDLRAQYERLWGDG